VLQKLTFLQQNFFLLTEKINLQNITNNKSVTYFLNIEERVITNQIKQIIKSLFTKKTADSDNVLNEILKMIYKAIKKNVTIIITQYFTDNSLSLY